MKQTINFRNMGMQPCLAQARLALLVIGFFASGFSAFLLFKPEYPYSWYDHQRVMQMLWLTLSMVFLPFTSEDTRHRLLGIMAMLAVAGVALPLLHGVSPRAMYIEALSLALLVIAASWWAGLIRAHGLSDALLLSAQLAVAWYVFLSLLSLAALLVVGVLPNPFTFLDGFSHPRFFGAWITLSWPLLLLRPRILEHAGARSARLWGAALFVLLALWWALAFFSGTRATWLAAVVTLVLTALCSRSARSLAVRAALAIFTGFLLHQMLFVLIPAWATGLDSANALDRLREGMALSGRDVLWKLAWQGIVERPWFGAGPMMFSATNNGVASTTHNITLQLAYEWGVPFALMVIACAGRALWRQFLLCRTDGGPVRLVLWMCIVGGLVEAQFDGLLSAPHSQFLFTVLCAWLLSLDAPAQPRLDGWRARAWPVVRFVPLAVALLLWWSVRPELSRLEAWEYECFKLTGVRHFQPRYWGQGVIFPDN
jgi:putative inorganic carbon (hco3(-)) transporter